jgi:hypothetical protein
MMTSDALRTLLELPGIGSWSAELVLLRGLERLGVFPPGDVGAARGLSALLELEPGRGIESRRIEPFGKFRGYLPFFGLGGSLLRKGLIHAALNHAYAAYRWRNAEARAATRVSGVVQWQRQRR